MRVDVIKQNEVSTRAIVAVGVIFAAAFSVVVVTFGIDSVMSGAHDMFHDFRHVIGMACH